MAFPAEGISEASSPWMAFYELLPEAVLGGRVALEGFCGSAAETHRFPRQRCAEVSPRGALATSIQRCRKIFVWRLFLQVTAATCCDVSLRMALADEISPAAYVLCLWLPNLGSKGSSSRKE